MNELLKLFKDFTITEEYPNKGYLSEIASPSRLYMQLDDPELLQLDEDINEYFGANYNSRPLMIDESNVQNGFKIATYICGKWHRATILSSQIRDDNICIFADDYGTKGYVNIKFCRYLPNEFTNVPRKSIKACLHGLAPPKDTRLFDIKATDFIIKFCFNRIFRIKMVHYNQNDDFYEIIACRDDGEILNDHLIKAGLAKPISHENTNYSVFYPSFDLFEKSEFYETYSHRHLYLKRGVNFNAFEEDYINPKQPYEAQLFELLRNERFAAIKEVFELLHSLKCEFYTGHEQKGHICI